MKKSNALWVGGLVMLLAATSALALADTDTTTTGSGQGRGRGGKMERSDRRAEMTQFFTNNDYAGWKEYVTKNMPNSPLLSVVTEQNFAQFAQVHTLLSAGKLDEAKTLAQSMGLPDLPLGERRGGPPTEESTEIRQAITNNDYATWQKLVSEKNANAPILKVVTADNWSEFVRFHQLLKNGQFDEAKTLAQTLGLPEHRGAGNGQGRGHGPKQESAEIRQAITNSDYATWQKLVSEKNANAPILKVVTADNWSEFVQFHQLKAAGQMDEAKALAEKLGLPQPGPQAPTGQTTTDNPTNE